MRAAATIAVALLLVAAAAALRPTGRSAAFSTSYDSNEALDALYFIKATYCDPTAIGTWTCQTCVKHHTGFTDVNYKLNATDDFLYFSGYNPTTNEIVVAFRGTSNLANWIIDLDTKFTDYPKCAGCEVHAGFLRAWHSVSTSVMADYARLSAKYPSATVLVTGHSLGAAVAVHGGLDISLAGAPFVKLYTFGTPRVGNAAFAAWSTTALEQGKQFRITHAADPVPHLPGEFLGFRHIPHELWYNNNGDSSFRNCTDSATAEDPKCADSVGFLHYKVYDHVMYLGKCTHCEYEMKSNGECPI